MLKILNVFSRILDVIFSDGNKRLKLAVENVIYMAFTVVCAWGAYELIQYLSEELSVAGSCSSENAGYCLLAVVGVITCIGTGIYTLIAGVASQAVLLVLALLGSLISLSRGKNFLAFIIALVSLVAACVGALLLFGILKI